MYYEGDESRLYGLFQQIVDDYLNEFEEYWGLGPYGRPDDLSTEEWEWVKTLDSLARRFEKAFKSHGPDDSWMARIPDLLHYMRETEEFEVTKDDIVVQRMEIALAQQVILEFEGMAERSSSRLTLSSRWSVGESTSRRSPRFCPGLNRFCPPGREEVSSSRDCWRVVGFFCCAWSSMWIAIRLRSSPCTGPVRS